MIEEECDWFFDARLLKAARRKIRQWIPAPLSYARYQIELRRQRISTHQQYDTDGISTCLHWCYVRRRVLRYAGAVLDLDLPGRATSIELRQLGHDLEIRDSIRSYKQNVYILRCPLSGAQPSQERNFSASESCATAMIMTASGNRQATRCLECPSILIYYT